MIVAKQVADLITLTRAFLALVLAWLGISQGEAAMPLVVWLLIADWTGDSIDGVLARRSRVQYTSWIGEHDLHVDMSVSFGLLLYLISVGYVNIWVGVAYVVMWGLVFWQMGLQPSLGMLFQAPIYAWFIYTAIAVFPLAGRWLLVWILMAILLTWPRFPQQTIPGFLDGMRQAWLALRQADKK